MTVAEFKNKIRHYFEASLEGKRVKVRDPASSEPWTGRILVVSLSSAYLTIERDDYGIAPYVIATENVEFIDPAPEFKL